MTRIIIPHQNPHSISYNMLYSDTHTCSFSAQRENPDYQQEIPYCKSNHHFQKPRVSHIIPTVIVLHDAKKYDSNWVQKI